MQLTHKIQLNPTPEQAVYFKKAAGTTRRVWNWALGKWNDEYTAGKKPNAMKLKKLFNGIKYQEFPWLKEMHRDSHSQPFKFLGVAWNRFFNEIKTGKQAHAPKFKKKNKSRDSFYVANDKFWVEEKTIKLPRIGLVKLTETLRFAGKILSATVSRQANKWFVAISVEVPEEQYKKKRTKDNSVGVDLGVKAVATLSTGESITAPRPLKAALRRVKIRGRSVSRKVEAAKIKIGFSKKQKLPKGTKLILSKNHQKSALQLAILHARIVNLRTDSTHKLTTRLCRENQVIGIEDLHVAGMVRNRKLAQAISDVSMGRIRRQLEYKVMRYGNHLVIADRWYPSSKECSHCHLKNKELQLSDRTWVCQGCNTLHDRELNASTNLERLATKTALLEASALATKHTGRGRVPFLGGKVTLVRYEGGQQDASGQEINCEHISSHF